MFSKPLSIPRLCWLVAGCLAVPSFAFAQTVTEILDFTGNGRGMPIILMSGLAVSEAGDVFVHCTSNLPPRRSEIIRCYFYSAEVCNAGLGALIGVGIGAAVGFVAAAIIVTEGSGNRRVTADRN